MEYPSWMPWNLLLAIVPLVLAVTLFARPAETRRPTALWWVGLTAFFLFLPNAPYVITDIIHLRGDAGIASGSRSVMLGVLVRYSAFFALGLLSYAFALSRLRQFAEVRLPRASWPAIAVVVHLASAFGIVLGRLPRLNSWYVVTHPLMTLRSILGVLAEPQAIALTIAMAAVIAVGSTVAKIVAKLAVRSTMSWMRWFPSNG